MVSAMGASVQMIPRTEARQALFMVRCIAFYLIEKVPMSEEGSEGEFSDEDTTAVGGPSVITFQDPSKKSEASASDRALKKAFMVRNSCGIHI